MSSAVWTLAESFEWRRLEPDCLWMTSFVRLFFKSLCWLRLISVIPLISSFLMFSALASYVIVSSCLGPWLWFFSSVTCKMMTSPVWSTACCYLACFSKASFRDFLRSYCIFSVVLVSSSESARMCGRFGVFAPPVVAEGDSVCFSSSSSWLWYWFSLALVL